MSKTESAVILVAGPTASGKSALAADLAAELRGAVINADAMQVYRGLPILTAQPDAHSHRRAPHWLYESIDPALPHSAGQWLIAAQRALRDADTAGLIPIFTGGTGMYFQILLRGIAEIPPIPAALREELRQDYQRDGEAACRTRLAALDAEAATRIVQGDRLRLLRALEIVLATGKTQRYWQENTQGGLLGRRRVIPLLLLPPREALYAVCDDRFVRMARRGALEEAQTVKALSLAPQLPAMKIIGLREIMDFLDGERSWDDTLAAAQQATRNYAKRQMTWFRNQWLNNKTGFDLPPILQHNFYCSDQCAGFLAAIQPILKG